MDDAKPRRFQFSIQEMLFAAVLAFAGLCLLMPFLRACAGRAARLTPSTEIVFGLVIVIATICGVFCGLWRAHRERPGWLGRLLFMGVGAATAWVLLGPLLMLLVPRPQGPHCTAAAAGCKAYVEAQEIYHRTDWDGNGVLEYATSLQELLKQGGLVDTSFAAAEGLPGKAQPKAGYVCKVLTAQGPHATGGRKSYLDGNGRMTLGYALVAAPAVYNVTGQDMYVINQKGVMYEADFGADTARIFTEMTEFDPDPAQGWEPSE